MGGSCVSGWVGSSQFLPLWLCCPPSNGICQTSVATSLPLLLGHTTVWSFPSEIFLFSVPLVLRAAERVFTVTQHLHCYSICYCHCWALGRWGKIAVCLCFCFLPGNSHWWTTAYTLLCFVSAPFTRCSCSVCWLLRRNVDCNLFLRAQIIWAVTQHFCFWGHSELWAESLVPVSGLPFFPLPLFPDTHPPSDVSMHGSLR